MGFGADSLAYVVMTFAVVFPGQGSQSVDMLSAFSALDPVKQTFEEASLTLGTDMWQIMSDAAAINRTEITQPLMLTADIAIWRAWRGSVGESPAVLAGHSLGEYAALVAAEAIDFASALELVQMRAECMNAAPPGAMAAILGLDADKVSALCEEAAGGEVLEPVNFNAPGQIVIAGKASAVARAIALAKTHGAKRAIELPVSIASHCSLMREPAQKFSAALAATTFRAPVVPVLSNVNAEPHRLETLRGALQAQLDHPVQWIATIEACVAEGVSDFYECGPGKVLVGLGKRIAPQARWIALGERAVFDEVSA